MKETLVPESICLDCGKRLDCATRLRGADAPVPGDVTICLNCGHIMVFADDMTLRNPTDAEIVAIAGNREVVAVQKVRVAIMPQGDRRKA